MKEKRLPSRNSKLSLSEAEIASRKRLVDWMCDIGDSLKLNPETIHKAVNYIDHIMCENRVEERELQDIALICILLSGKLTERDPEVNSIVSLFRKRMSNPKLDLMKYEVQVLAHLDWDLKCITAMEFIQFFASQGILFSNDSIGSVQIAEQSAKSLRQYAEFFADLCLQEYELIQADPLIVSAGIIAAARKTLKFNKVWSEELEELTTVMKKEAENFGSSILKYYERLFPKTQMKKKLEQEPQRSTNKENEMPKYSRPVSSSSTMNYQASNIQMMKRCI